jgi:immunoglobulin-binding protein 1
MAHSDMTKDEVSTETLSEMFKKGLDIQDGLDSSSKSTNSKEFQHKVRKGILLLEDATRFVSLLDVFSRNETVSEVPTEHLKYFLLPVLLGDLNSKLVDQDRLEVIQIVEAYYIDFLTRVKDYEIANVPNITKSTEVVEHKPSSSSTSSTADLAKMNREREEKIRRYKESKAIEVSLKELKLAMANPSRDEDIIREYYLKLIRKYSFMAMDELTSFETEKGILQHMAKMREAGVPMPRDAAKQPPPRPLKTIIITRDAVQKEVFGMGYKNLPVLSIEEFYEGRVRDGWFPAPQAAGSRSASNALQDRVADEEAAKHMEYAEAAQKEAKEENDDPEELARKRNMDEYKDDHKRGEGNRHNRG